MTNALSVGDNSITGTAYSVLATSGNLTLDASATVAVDGATSVTFSDEGTLYATFSQSGTQDLSINAAGGDVILADSDVLSVYGTTIVINNDANAGNLIGVAAAGAAAGQALYWGDKLICDASETNCGWSTSVVNADYWQLGTECLAPYNLTLDLYVGGTATSAATFAVEALTGNVQLDGDLTVGATDPIIVDMISLSAIQNLSQQWQLTEGANYSQGSSTNLNYESINASVSSYYWVTRIWSLALSYDYMSYNTAFTTSGTAWARNAVMFSLRATWE